MVLNFRKRNRSPIPANPIRDIQNRPLGIQLHKDRDQQQHRRDKDQCKQREDNIKTTFCNRSSRKDPAPLAARSDEPCLTSCEDAKLPTDDSLSGSEMPAAAAKPIYRRAGENVLTLSLTQSTRRLGKSTAEHCLVSGASRINKSTEIQMNAIAHRRFPVLQHFNVRSGKVRNYRILCPPANPGLCRGISSLKETK